MARNHRCQLDVRTWQINVKPYLDSESVVLLTYFEFCSWTDRKTIVAFLTSITTWKVVDRYCVPLHVHLGMVNVHGPCRGSSNGAAGGCHEAWYLFLLSGVVNNTLKAHRVRNAPFIGWKTLRAVSHCWQVTSGKVPWSVDHAKQRPFNARRCWNIMHNVSAGVNDSKHIHMPASTSKRHPGRGFGNNQTCTSLHIGCRLNM